MVDFFDEISKSLAGKKVGIEEFCESSDYCNKRLYPRQKLLLKIMFLEELTGKEEDVLSYWINGGRNGNEILISPKIRERADYLREHNFPHFREMVLVGGRRSSKGFVTGLALAKKMFDVLQYQDPASHFQIDPDKEIYFSCIAASQDQAKKYQYADFSSTVARCKAMENNVTKVQELEFSVATEADKALMERFKQRSGVRSRDISKLRGVAHAANASTIRGSATIALCFDEMAHMQQEGESAQTAASVYEAAVPALAQFGKDAMIFCNSSPYTKIGKFYDRYIDGLKVDDNGKPESPYMFTFQFPSWALFEGYQGVKSKWHPPHRKVITASPDWDPDDDQHSEDDKDAIMLARDELRQDPDTYKVERRGQFAEIMDAFLKPEMVDRAYMGKPLRDGAYLPLKTNWNGASFLHRYKAHLDPSSTTAGFGFAMGHIEELEDDNGELRSHVVMDIVHRWKPSDFPEGVVDWEKVMNDITRWVDIFQPYEVTFDQFQSSAPIQWMNKWLREHNMSHIRVYEKTATAQYNWNRANVFRTALYQDLVHIPNDTADCEYSAQELKHLQQINTAGRFPRVDRQEIGPVQTKDMADCIMEVTESLIGNLLSNEMRLHLAEGLAMGAPGGYQIGGRHEQIDQFYMKEKGTHTFREQRGSTIGNSGRTPSQWEQLREQLGGLSAARGQGWSSRGERSRRSRGF
jgi:hypothetical protein